MSAAGIGYTELVAWGICAGCLIGVAYIVYLACFKHPTRYDYDVDE